MLKIFLCISLLGAPAAFAGNTGTERAGQKTRNVVRRQLSTILLSGLIGGIFGLSTLSFYGRPQENLSNIPAGIALGLIVGVVVSTSQLITNPGALQATSEPRNKVFTDRVTANSPAMLALNWKISF